MRLPDYEEGLEIAALTLGVDRDEAELLIKAERLHQAILIPMACKGGAPIHRTPGEITKCLLVECATNRVVPRQQVRFGWLMAQRAIELSGRRWRNQRGNAEQLKQFGKQLEAGIDPGPKLARWMEERIRTGGSRPHTKARVLHIAGPMTPPPEANMAKWETAVDDGLSRFLDEEEEPDAATTGRPNLYPIRGASEVETCKLIEERLHTADGLVVLAPEASWGAAIEVEVGLRGSIPTLFLHPADRPLGKRARARLDAVEATVREFEDDPDDPEKTARAIADLVYRWLKSNYAEILAMQHRRRSTSGRLARFLDAVRTRKTQLGKLEERKALVAAGLTEPRARALIEEPWQLPHGSVAELIALSNTYRVPANLDGIDPEPPADRPSHLTPLELRWLSNVVEDDRIPAPEVVELVATAQTEVSLPGRRRKLFTDARSWRLLRVRMHEKQ